QREIPHCAEGGNGLVDRSGTLVRCMSEFVVPPGKPIKLVVWDLDDALWSGAIADGAAPVLPPDVRGVIAELDQRGILQSVVASAGGERMWARLARLELADYFLCAQLAAPGKAEAVRDIARALNLALDATLVIGGDATARGGDAACVHPEVRA